MTHVNPNFDQTNYRIRSGDSVGLNTDSDWAAALNTGATIAVSITFRVRVEIDEDAGATTPSSPGGQLECRLNGGTYQNVTTTSSIMKAVGSGQFTHDDATTDVLSGSGRTFDTGRGSDTGAITTEPTLSNEHTEYEYCVQIVASDVADTDTIDFRVSGLNAYTNTGTITVSKPSILVGTRGTEWARQHPVMGSRINKSHPLARELVAVYLFNEMTGSTLNDYSGNGHHGEASGLDDTNRISHTFGSCVRFNDGVTNEYFEITAHPDFDFRTLIKDAEGYTLAGVISDMDATGPAASTAGWIVNRQDETSTGLDWGLGVRNASQGGTASFVHNPQSTGTVTVNGTTDLTGDGLTHVIVGTYSRMIKHPDGTNRMHLYVDAVEEGQDPATDDDAEQHANPVLIGNHFQDSNQNFKGNIHAVFLWARPLSTEEVDRFTEDPFQMFEGHDDFLDVIPLMAFMPQAGAPILRTVTDQILLTDRRYSDRSLLVSDDVLLDDMAYKLLDITIQDSIALSELQLSGAERTVLALDGLLLSDAKAAELSKYALDFLALADQVHRQKLWYREQVDYMMFRDSVDAQAIRQRLVSEQLLLADGVLQGTVRDRTILDTLFLSDAATKALEILIRSNLLLADSVTADSSGPVLVERLVVDQILLLDAMVKEHEITATDSLLLSDASFREQLKTLIDRLLLRDDAAVGREVGVVETDTVMLDDADYRAYELNMIDQLLLSDLVARAQEILIRDNVLLSDDVTATVFGGVVQALVYALLKSQDPLGMEVTHEDDLLGVGVEGSDPMGMDTPWEFAGEVD